MKLKLTHSMEKAYRKFEAEYWEEVREMLVLTSEAVGGACLFEGEIWEPGAGFLASVDLATGEFRKEKGSLRWLAEKKQGKGWGYKIKPLTIYRVKCRKRRDTNAQEGNAASSGNFWMLVEMAGHRAKHPELERVLAEYKRGVTFTDGLCGRFELERRFDWFKGDVKSLEGNCIVYLACDEAGGETADGALAYFRQIYGNLPEWGRKVRVYAAEELTSLANDWQEDSDDEGEAEIITKEMFAERIRISELSIKPDGDYTVYCDDDDMFWGHVIVVEGNMENGMERADIEG